MEILQTIDELEETIEKSFGVFGYACLNKDELLSIIGEIRLKLPEDLKQAKWVKDEREKILADGRKEAERRIAEAQDKVIAMIDEHEITKAAKQKAEEILEDARQKEAEMQRNAIYYADTLMDKIDQTTSNVLEQIRESRRQLHK